MIRGRSARGVPRRPRRGSARKTLVVTWLVVVVALGIAADAAPALHGPGRPNVLLIVTDDQRLEGTMVMMPKTRQWFEDGGTNFPGGGRHDAAAAVRPAHRSSPGATSTTPACAPIAAAALFLGPAAHPPIGAAWRPGDTLLAVNGKGPERVERPEPRAAVHPTARSVFDSRLQQPIPRQRAGRGEADQRNTQLRYPNYIGDKAVSFDESERSQRQPAWFLLVPGRLTHRTCPRSGRRRSTRTLPIPAWDPNPREFLESDFTLDKPPRAFSPRIDRTRPRSQAGAPNMSADAAFHRQHGRHRD